jgi:membrane protein DedA with SNARE-associated domain
MECPVDCVSLWLFAGTSAAAVIIGATWGYLIGRTDGIDSVDHEKISAQNDAALARAELSEMKMMRGRK